MTSIISFETALMAPNTLNLWRPLGDLMKILVNAHKYPKNADKTKCAESKKIPLFFLVWLAQVAVQGRFSKTRIAFRHLLWRVSFRLLLALTLVFAETD